jgi:DNA polymerase (family 10)
VHPSGRLINERPAYDVNFEEVLNVAAQTNTAVEINCYPKRLDLDDIHVRRAKEKGVMLSLGTDSHSPEQFQHMDLGVAVARRGWLEPGNVLNCLKLKEFLKRIKQKH